MCHPPCRKETIGMAWSGHSRMFYKIKPESTHHRGSITVWLTSCLTAFDLTKQVKLLLIQHMQSS